MRKKFYILLLIIQTSIISSAAITINGLDYELNEDNMTAKVTRNTQCSGNITIPATIEYRGKNYSVTCIDFHAFYQCDLKSVTIGSNITEIREDAFEYCTHLTSVKIPNNVVTMGNGVFTHCLALETVVIEDEVQNLGNYTFSYCNNIKFVYNYSLSPQKINGNIFGPDPFFFSAYNRTLYVPEESIELYKDAEVWKEFKNILPIQNPEKVDNANSSVKHNTPKLLHNGQILILRGDNVYTIIGQEVK